jgi:hypothetical protein
VGYAEEMTDNSACAHAQVFLSVLFYHLHQAQPSSDGNQRGEAMQ